MSSAPKRLPGTNSSYCVGLLEKPLPTVTITPALKPNSPPTAKPTSTTSTERWKSRLPASRR